jgi:hypothetical protein
LSDFFSYGNHVTNIPNRLYRLQPVAAFGIRPQPFQEIEENFVVETSFYPQDPVLFTLLSTWPQAPEYLDLIEEWLRDLRR